MRSIHKNSCLKLSKYKADTLDMIQNTLEENIMDKAIFTRGLWGKGVHGECWQNGETSTQQKSTKIPQTVNTIESFLNQIPKAS